MLRFVRVVGTREYLRAYWGDEDCPSAYGTGHRGVHNAERVLGVLPEIPPWDAERGCFSTLVSDSSPEAVGKYPAEAWPAKCDHCPAAAPADATRMFCRAEHFDTPSGCAEPNDCFYRAMGPNHACAWTDCDGRHLVIVLPLTGFREGASVRGLAWDPQERARNCAKPQDTTHRCWIIEGTPPRLSSVESPRRCGAGKCSTEIGDLFHKTLKDGEWV